MNKKDFKTIKNIHYEQVLRRTQSSVQQTFPGKRANVQNVKRVKEIY
jgi:hypothetical protein